MFLINFLLICMLLTGLNCQEFRIVGGTNVTDRSQFAYQALLLYKGAPFCGGTILDENHVLTAAHCCYPESDLKVKPSEVTIVVGNLDLYDKSNVKKVTNVVVHEEYNPEDITNDVAVLRISGIFENVPNIQPINLTTENLTNGTCRVSGWGRETFMSQVLSRWLQYVEVPIVDWDTCNVAYFNLSKYTIGKNTICAGIAGKDSCQGDSGGPLVCFGKLTGIVSYGYRCGVRNYPGIYTEVAKYTDWIENAKYKSSAIKDKSISVLLVLVLKIISDL